MTMFKTTLLATALLAATPLVAQAESSFASTNGAAPLTATARLDFQVTIPKILLLQVGAAGSINRIDFDLSGTPSIVGNGTAIDATAGSGDVGNGTVTAILKGNNGDITLSSATTGALSNGAAGDTISYSQILATSSNAALPSPALADTGTTSATVAATGKVVNQSAQWTYKYANAAIVAPGVYGGTNANNSRVTYTASMP
ncbi:MAG: hypothetical protein ACYC42_08280 [Lysobacter sp.]